MSREKVRGPHGDEYEVVGRAGSVQIKRTPHMPGEADQDLLVVKHDNLFVCSQPDGDICVDTTGVGLYADDTRYMSQLSLKIGGRAPVLLSSSASPGYEAFVDLANPETLENNAITVPQMTLNVRRVRLVANRLYERIEIHNHGAAAAETKVEVTLAADFADIFEVRGVLERMSRGRALAPKEVNGGLLFGYIGEDEVFRETIVELDPKPAALELSDEDAKASWQVELGPRSGIEIEITVEPSLAGERRRKRSFLEAEDRTREATEEWGASCTQIDGLRGSFNRLIEASTRDLRVLTTPTADGVIVAAGVPWYVAPFGRDSLLSCYEMLLLNPEPARNTLLFLARHQARADDPLRDAERGKILHELRVGELARCGYIPHTPYFGTADATPLFLMLTGAYYRWTADLATMATLKDSLDAAIGWIDTYGDGDGDGFVDYSRRSPAGLRNHGWKDSEDSIVHADGTVAQGRIALAEVQGYVYLGKQHVAEVYDALGEPDIAERLRSQAAALKEAFNEIFWMPDEGTFALALDGDKPVKSVTSNPGHCLFCNIVDANKAAPLAERLMADDMFSGWGIRTLSSESPAYNPMSYHNGSVWPHDNAIIAAGFKRYGFTEAAEAITTALFEAGLESPEARLPELFCGFNREDNVPYTTYQAACRLQAWAAAAPFMLLQSMLGISARAPEGLLTVNEPELPSWLDRVELRNIRVADARLGLAFERTDGITSFSVIEHEGDIRLTLQK